MVRRGAKRGMKNGMDSGRGFFFMPFFNQLPAKNRVDLANPERFPEFYEKEIAFDKGHFLIAGAHIYTDRLVQTSAPLMKNW